MSGRVAKLWLSIGLLSTLLLGACADDESITSLDQEFGVTLTVTHPDGSPAVGVRVAGMPVLSNWVSPNEPPPAGLDHPWHRIQVGFDMPELGFARVTVRDVAGTPVRDLFAAPTAVGHHVAEWDGRDDQDQPLPGGWYNAHVVLTWSPTSGQTLDIPVMLEVCDPDWHQLGATDADGRLVIDDRRLVPALYDPEPVAGMVFTTETLLRLESEYDDGQYLTFDAADVPLDVSAVWNPDYQPFRFELQVVDQAGDPVSGVAVGSMPALPDWAFPWGPGDEPARSSVAIPFELDAPHSVRVHIQDVAGAVLRDIELGPRDAGVHVINWDGRNEDGVHTRGGWYEVVLLLSENGVDPSWTAVDSAGVVQAAFDPGQASLGETDDAGRLVITDRRLVPGFWALPTCTFRNESGAEIGTYDLTTTTWLFCDAPADAWAWAVVDAVDGPQAVPVTMGGDVLPGGGGADAARKVGPAAPLPMGRLRGPYPNPFN